MPDKHVPISENEEQLLSLRNQQLISYLEDLWKRPYRPSSETLKRIIAFLTQFPETYQVLGMTKIAEYLASTLSLHFLDIMAIFQQKAEAEGIGKEEQIETLRGVMPELFPEMMGISKHILVRSLDDLVTLGNITLSLYTLSQVDTAEEAQGWMYELPVLYWRQLTQERLITNIQVQLTVTEYSTTMRFSGATSWKSSLPNPVEVSPATHEIPTIA
jgi:hypothetical protein